MTLPRVSPLACLVVSLAMATVFAEPSTITIRNVESDANQTSLFIRGSNFCATPTVTLDGLVLAVQSSAPTQLIVSQPTLASATYLLVVSCGSGNASKTASFIVAIGAIGPQGEKGDTGDQGIQGIREPRTCRRTRSSGTRRCNRRARTRRSSGPQGPQETSAPPGQGEQDWSFRPQGPQGNAGALTAGIQDRRSVGPQGPQGNAGATGPQGIQDPSVRLDHRAFRASRDHRASRDPRDPRVRRARRPPSRSGRVASKLVHRRRRSLTCHLH